MAAIVYACLENDWNKLEESEREELKKLNLLKRKEKVLVLIDMNRFFWCEL